MRAEQNVDCGALSRQPFAHHCAMVVQRKGPGCREAGRTLPAPAGPMTMTPYLLILAVYEFALESDCSCLLKKSVEVGRLGAICTHCSATQNFCRLSGLTGMFPHYEGQLQPGGGCGPLSYQFPGAPVQIFIQSDSAILVRQRLPQQNTRQPFDSAWHAVSANRHQCLA